MPEAGEGKPQSVGKQNPARPPPGGGHGGVWAPPFDPNTAPREPGGPPGEPDLGGGLRKEPGPRGGVGRVEGGV